MQFPNSPRFNNNICTRNRLRHWEIRTINLPPLSATAWRWLWSVRKRSIYVTRVAG
jgi:hypothetical protein